MKTFSTACIDILNNAYTSSTVFSDPSPTFMKTSSIVVTDTPKLAIPYSSFFAESDFKWSKLHVTARFKWRDANFNIVYEQVCIQPYFPGREIKTQKTFASSLLRTNSNSVPTLLRISADGITRLIALMAMFSFEAFFFDQCKMVANAVPDGKKLFKRLKIPKNILHD